MIQLRSSSELFKEGFWGALQLRHRRCFAMFFGHVGNEAELNLFVLVEGAKCVGRICGGFAGAFQQKIFLFSESGN